MKVAAMVLILGRRMNREDSGIRDSPAVKRKVLSNKLSRMNININLTKLFMFSIMQLVS